MYTYICVCVYIYIYIYIKTVYVKAFENHKILTLSAAFTLYFMFKRIFFVNLRRASFGRMKFYANECYFHRHIPESNCHRALTSLVVYVAS